MTYPNQPGTPGYQPYPQQPAYGQPPMAPPGYPPAQPPYYPPQAPPVQQFAPQVPGYPPQYGTPAAPEPVLARGTLEDYLDQPSSGGGVAITKFFGVRPQGARLQLRVTRDLTNADVRQQTDINNIPATYKSTGKPKWVLILPVEVLWSSDGSHPTIFTEGVASIWLKGATSDAFKAAMAAAGISDPDKALARGKLAGVVLLMESAGEKPPWKPGMSPAKLYNFQYTPNNRELSADPTFAAPQAAAPVQAPAQVPFTAPVAPPAMTAPATTPPMAPPASAGYALQQPADPAAAYYQATGQYPPQAPAASPQAPPAPPQYAPPAAPVAPPAPPAPGQLAMDPEKLALLARLQGNG